MSHGFYIWQPPYTHAYPSVHSPKCSKHHSSYDKFGNVSVFSVATCKKVAHRSYRRSKETLLTRAVRLNPQQYLAYFCAPSQKLQLKPQYYKGYGRPRSQNPERQPENSKDYTLSPWKSMWGLEALFHCE